MKFPLFKNPYKAEKKPEERGASFSFNNWANFYSWFYEDQKDQYTGEKITPRKSQQLDTVFACINLIAQDFATTPSPTKQEIDGMRQVISTDSVHSVLNKRSNRLMSAYNLKYISIWHVLGWGNAYWLPIRDANQQVKEIIPLMPWDVEIVYSGNDIYYQWFEKSFAEWELCHFKLFSEDGVQGIAPMSWNAKLAGYKIIQDKYSSRSIGTKPPGFISGPQTNTNLQQVAENWSKHMKGDDPTGVPYLPGELKFNPLMISPEEAQNLETKEYTDTKIASIYRVPLSKLQNTKNSKYNTYEQEQIAYSQDALMPIYEMFKQEIDYKLFSERNKSLPNPKMVVFDMWNKVRADLKTRVEKVQVMRTTGLANADELRQEFDMLPLKDELGQDVYIQGAMMPLSNQKDAKIGGQQQQPQQEEEDDNG